MSDKRYLRLAAGFASLILLCLLWNAPGALATPFGVSFESSCGVQVAFGTGSNHSDNGDSTGSIDLGCGGSGFYANFYGPGEDARTQASSVTGGTIEIGSVGVQLVTKAQSTSLIDGAIADSSVNASWWDTIKITGPSLGETAQFRLIGGIAGSMTCNGETAGNVSYSISWGQANGLNFSDDNCSNKLAGTQTALLTTTVGQQVTLGGLILSSARAVAGNSFLTSENDVSAGDTFSLFITPITPGVSYISASGADYAPPASSIPEPSSWLLMVTGFGALCSLTRFASLRPFGFRNEIFPE
jgi:hypothetical protein